MSRKGELSRALTPALGTVPSTAKTAVTNVVEVDFIEGDYVGSG